MDSRLPHVLVVDDDPDITDLVESFLGRQGMKVTSAQSARDMQAHLQKSDVDLVLLDLGLPDADGLTLMRTLRDQWKGAVIIISGRGESIDRILGLELGADDYLGKPFDLRELAARVKSVLRRSSRAPAATGTGNRRERLRFGEWTVDLGSREVRRADSELLALTSGEFDLLVVFLRNPMRVLTRDQIMDLTRHRDAGPFDRAIDMQVGRLRRKIEPDPAQPTWIKSVRGVGYIFATEVEQV